jgi:NhaP-type Na+/H+ or K+/H+ antiporter
MKRSVIRRSLIGLALSAIVAVGLPQLELAYACRQPTSEGCVWGHALISVNTAATGVIVGIPVGALVVWWLGRTSRAGRRDGIE